MNPSLETIQQISNELDNLSEDIEKARAVIMRFPKAERWEEFQRLSELLHFRQQLRKNIDYLGSAPPQVQLAESSELRSSWRSFQRRYRKFMAHIFQKVE